MPPESSLTSLDLAADHPGVVNNGRPTASGIPGSAPRFTLLATLQYQYFATAFGMDSRWKWGNLPALGH